MQEMSRNICVDVLKNIVRRENSSVDTSLLIIIEVPILETKVYMHQNAF